MSAPPTAPNPLGNEPKKMDPGWNDPPTLNYSSSNPPPRSRITNKRIAFPTSSISNPLPPAGSAEENKRTLPPAPEKK